MPVVRFECVLTAKEVGRGDVQQLDIERTYVVMVDTVSGLDTDDEGAVIEVQP